MQVYILETLETGHTMDAYFPYCYVLKMHVFLEKKKKEKENYLLT